MTRATRAKKFGRRGLLSRTGPHVPKSRQLTLGSRRSTIPANDNVHASIERRKVLLRGRLAALETATEYLSVLMEEIRTRLDGLDRMESE